jgi:hypothetical protein
MKLTIGSVALLLLPMLAGAQERPDFSGTWMPERSAELGWKGFPRDGWPYTEYGQQLQDEYQAVFDPTKDDPSFFCVQPGMPESMAQFAPFPLEIIQRDNDVTMFFEAWSQYRKIWMDGFDRPEPILNSRMGYSVGHWEGEQLVIETTYLSERTVGRSLMSNEASFTERLYVTEGSDGRRRLISDIVFTDPVMYREPINQRGVWVDSPNTPILEYVCSEGIYAEHLEEVRAAGGR